MKRMLEKQLLEWKESKRRKPLILRGARQVGKTWLVENILAGEFENYVKIDLEKMNNLHLYFEGELDPKKIVNYLELSTKPITPGKTLLFLDEIQACPRAITALRYFYEDMPELHVVAAGSLLEFAFGEISIPVGRVQYMQVYPMSFYEYLNAIRGESLAQESLKHPGIVDEQVQNMLLEELRRYFFIGGMPECVETFSDTESMIETFRVQSEEIESYRDDFSKYKPHVDPACLDAVFLNCAKSVGDQLIYTKLNDGHTGQTNRKAFDLLNKAGVLKKIPSASPSGLPLGATANQKKFKASILDIGLMQRLCRTPVDLELQRKDLLTIFRGKLAEQYVAQELLAYHGPDLFYWSRDARGSSAEVDYLLAFNGNIYPIEVKSGAAGSLKSLHMLLQKYPNCPRGLVLYDGTYKSLPEQKLEFLPLYSTGGMSGERISDSQYPVS
ncbi:MAG: AAA family ATPase [Candidatus Aegiribacteria sp.]|nr:AAA family ATPase [Candidatus Aegiribacteria sp.]